MIYKIIFTIGDQYESDFLDKGVRRDILILTENDQYYHPQYIILERLINEVRQTDAPCYLEDNLVIVPSVSKENVILSMEQIHKWGFEQFWMPESVDSIQKYFAPEDEWVSITLKI